MASSSLLKASNHLHQISSEAATPRANPPLYSTKANIPPPFDLVVEDLKLIIQFSIIRESIYIDISHRMKISIY